MLFLIVFVFSFCVLTDKTIAENAIQKTYFTAFVYPYQFENLLKAELSTNPNLYTNFNRCSQIAPRELQKLETILRQEHSRCPNNPACTQIAKDIAVVVDLQIKVNNLIEFMNTKMSNGTPQFLNSTIGS